MRMTMVTMATMLMAKKDFLFWDATTRTLQTALLEAARASGHHPPEDSKRDWHYDAVHHCCSTHDCRQYQVCCLRVGHIYRPAALLTCDLQAFQVLLYLLRLMTRLQSPSRTTSPSALEDPGRCDMESFASCAHLYMCVSAPAQVYVLFCSC